MKVQEFAALLGIPASKIRYYDRSGVISGKRREENNYREYDMADALNIYNALMLRSFDMSVSQAARANGSCHLKDVNDWLDGRITRLEEQIELETLQLARLRQLRAYFSEPQEGSAKVERVLLPKNYAVWTLGTGEVPDGRAKWTAKVLAEQFPFSYMALRVPQKSLWEDDCYQVQAGLGILEENRARCGIDLRGAACETPETERLTIWLEKENPFVLCRADLAPLFEEAGRQGLTLCGDALGRLYLGYRMGDRRAYRFVLGIPFR